MSHKAGVSSLARNVPHQQTNIRRRKKKKKHPVTHGPTSYVLFLIPQRVDLQNKPAESTYKETRWTSGSKQSSAAARRARISGIYRSEISQDPQQSRAAEPPTSMGVIYKILKQQRSMDLSLSSATRCKVQAAIKQRQQQRRLEDHMVEERDRDRERDQQPDQDQNQVQNHIDKDKEELAEQQLQQLCRFLAENAARKKVSAANPTTNLWI